MTGKDFGRPLHVIASGAKHPVSHKERLDCFLARGNKKASERSYCSITLEKSQHQCRERKKGRMPAPGQTKMPEFTSSKGYRDSHIAKKVAALWRAASACCIPDFKKKSWAPP